MTDRNKDIEETLRELVVAVERRWEGETPRKRENGVSPRMEEALERAKGLLGISPEDWER